MSSYFGVPPPTVAAGAAGLVLLILLVLAAFALRHRVLFRMAVRNIPRRPAQTSLIVFGLMLASLIITASLAVGDTLAYSLKQIQVRQIQGIDEAVVRRAATNQQGAGFSDGDFFSSTQAADVITKVLKDSNVKAAQGVIVSDGSIFDVRSGQIGAQNIIVLGVASDFTDVWGQLTNSSGSSLAVSALGSHEVYIGKFTAHKLGAQSGDDLQIFVAGKPQTFRIRDILNTEVNPNIARSSPIMSSVVMPLATMREMTARPDGFNAIYIHNQGSGGLDDLGPQGSVGQEINRTLRGSLTDTVSAQQLKDYLNQPPIRKEIQKYHDQDNFLDPTKPVIATLLDEMAKSVVTDEFKSIIQDDGIKFVVETAVTTSLGTTASQQQVQDAQRNLSDLYTSLNVDSTAASQLRAELNAPAVLSLLNNASADSSNQASVFIAQLVPELSRADTTARFKGLVADPSLRNALLKLLNVSAPSTVPAISNTMDQIALYQLDPYKASAVTFAETGGLGAIALLLGVSFFSLVVGILLIFLIFVMLAAERRAEMGMSRAVGLKRRHLTEMFLFEGFAYSLGAGLVGVAAGVAVGVVMIQILSTIFSTFVAGLTLEYHVEPTSVVIAFGVGIALTFIVVSVSAYRVSKLNIVAAIRDIDESAKRDDGIWRYFLNIFTNFTSAWRMLWRGHWVTFLTRSTIGTLSRIWTFIWSLFRRGPMTLLLGVGLIALGLATQFLFFYDIGVGVSAIACGLLVRWVLNLFHARPSISGRVGFSIAAAALVVYYGQLFGRVEKLLHIDKSYGIDKMNGGPEIFIASSLLLLLGAIWLVMYNSDLLIQAVMFFVRGTGTAGAIARTSMAYPMATKFRTGMAVAMFATVTFVIAYIAVFVDVLNQNLSQATSRAGGWQVVAGSPDNFFSGDLVTIPPADLGDKVAADPKVSADVKATGWENASQSVPVAQVVNGVAKAQPSNNGGRDRGFLQLHVVDDQFLSATSFALQPRASGYGSDRAAWDAVRDQEGFAIVDSNLIQAQGPGQAARVGGVDAKASTFTPFDLEINSTTQSAKGNTNKPWRVTVIGIIKNPIWTGMYVSRTTALNRSGMFSVPTVTTGSKPTQFGPEVPLTPTGFYFQLRNGIDANKARLDLGRTLVNYQLEPVVVADQLAQQSSGNVTLFNLLGGFLALGLIVGIAGLGVISTRAVVERRQQIGMLRALGFRRSLVQISFLAESSFIAILGLALGAGLGVWQSYRFLVLDQSFGNIDFHVPTGQLAAILIGAYFATLLTTFLPARAASRVTPAEALRYE